MAQTQLKITLATGEYRLIEMLVEKGWRRDMADAGLDCFRRGLPSILAEAMEAKILTVEPAEPDYKNLGQVVMHHLNKLVDSAKFPNGRLKDLMSGTAPTETELLRIALICGLSEDYVAGLPLNGGANAKTRID